MHIGALHKKDNVIQLATSTFDSHVYEILASLVSGATVIMLHPDDDFLQSITASQEGELFVGGVGIFVGYLEHNGLTAKALTEVHDELFYRTGYNVIHQLSLPIDRQQSSIDQRSGLASTTQITFDDDTSASLVNCTSLHHLTLLQLGLSIFYVFLFKLTHGETDLCISSINANRYRSELVNMIGMLVSTLPYRMQLNSHWSFDEVGHYVQEKCLSILEYSHYPSQHILADSHLT
ncbi:unnamed protein product [Adineta steineri]|uniref:Condensation domain-containing protein n=1 Tax=Adineta steineri TaxID=433720 RepID=A0A814JBK4_9BILA|nr:unnamed protein product [Adineta steineri]